MNVLLGDKCAWHDLTQFIAFDQDCGLFAASLSERKVEPMSSQLTRTLVLGLLLLLSAAFCGAVGWEVKLHSGRVLQTRYEPVAASFDDTALMFLSGTGNWVAIPKSEIEEVVSLTKALKHGTVLDAFTIFIGQGPNDAPTPEEEAELIAAAAQQPPQIPNFTSPLFAEPNSPNGIPLSLIFGTPLDHDLINNKAFQFEATTHLPLGPPQPVVPGTFFNPPGSRSVAGHNEF